MTKIIFCNHKFLDENEPCITVKDRGFLFGDAAFTTIKVIDGLVQFFDLHVERLKKTCEALRITYPHILIDDVLELIAKNSAFKGIYRLKIIITGGNNPFLNLQPRDYGLFLMTLKVVPEDVKEELKLTLFPRLVYRPSTHLKTLSYLDRLMISDYALSQGFDEAVVLSHEGFLLETAFSNIFWRLDQDIFIPDQSLELFMGITLQFWIEILKEMQFSIHFVKQKLQDISTKAQVYICNAIKGVQPVIVIDENRFHRDVNLERKIFKNVQYSK